MTDTIIFLGILGAVIRAFTYIGGKSKMVKWLFSHFPDDFTEFYDVCGGSGSVSLSLNPPPTCRKVVLNDYDYTIFNFYRTLKGERGEELENRLLNIQYSKLNWLVAHTGLQHYPILDCVDCAVYTYMEIVNSFSSMRSSYVKKDFEYLERATKKNIPLVRGKLANITVTNRDFIEILKEVTDPRAFVYIDVPYRMEYRSGAQLYKMELEEIQHFEMLEILKDAPYRWALSGYSSEDSDDSSNLYDILLSDYAEYREEFSTYKKGGGAKKGQKKTKVKEILWKNYK